MSKAPLLLFVYNRVDKTERILKNIEGLIDVDCTELYIFCDGAKEDNDTFSVNQTRNAVNEWVRRQVIFKTVNVDMKDSNYGLAKSIIEGVTKVINEKKRVIVLEDDLEISRDYLVYMNEALDFYDNVDSIWSISGYTPINLRDNSFYTYYSERAHCWGWATWLSRWNSVDWEVTDYSKIKYNLFRRFRFARWGNDLPTMLDSQIYGLIDSWYIRWTFEAYRQHRLTVYPSYTLVINHGLDGSGTHCVGERANEVIINRIKRIELKKEVYVDERIRREYKSTTGPFWRRELKWFLIKCGILPPEIGVMNLSAKLRL